MGDISFDERRRLVQAAIAAARGAECYIVELYDERAIVEFYGESADAGKSFEIPYTLDEDAQEVTVGDRKEVVRETTYRAKSVKFVGPDTIEGLAMPFGMDTDGEQFTKSTDLCLDWFGDAGRPVLYNHGLDRSMKAERVGRQTEYEIREEGIWAQSQLEANVRYRKAIDGLIEKGAIGYSSGAYAHLATKNAAGEITRWPWVELSLTPFPAHPGALGVHYVKSSADFVDLLDTAIPDPLKAALAALDEWAVTNSDDDALPDGVKFADLLDRLSVDGPAWVKARLDWHAKSGRSLSAATRDQLLARPTALRELADNLDVLLATDAPKPAKADEALFTDVAETLRRAALIDLEGANF